MINLQRIAECIEQAKALHISAEHYQETVNRLIAEAGKLVREAEQLLIEGYVDGADQGE